MRKFHSLALVAIVISLPSIAFSQDARSIFETAQKKQLERWDGVDVYVVNQTIVGNNTQTYFQRTEFKDANGNTQTAFLPASNAAVRAGQCMGRQTLTPEDWEAYATASERTGEALGSEVENGLEDAGLPGNLFSAMGSDGTVSADPRSMMGNNAQFVETAVLIGTESIDGRNAYHLRADNVGQVQEADGNEYKMDTINLWIDAEDYVPLRMQIDGTLTADGQTKPMTIENKQSDYRTVPGSRMYESFKQVMKISGVMDAEQEAQMREAAEQMAELEKQMASMPASQRQMMEKMMGPQLEMIRSMSSGGGFQMEIITSSIAINPEMTGGDGQPCPTSSTQNK